MRWRWPWISRKRHAEEMASKEAERNSIMAELREVRCKHRQELKGATYRAEIAERDKGYLEKVIAPRLERIAGSIVKASWEDDPSFYRRYRCVIEFDEHQVRRLFDWGNDKALIDYTARYIGDLAVREIHNMNRRR